MTDHLSAIGRFLVIFGLIIAGIGLVISLLPKIPFLGRLPGDIYIKKNNFIFYMPLVTSLILSILISLIISLLRK
ncbi:MAG: DUF2905 domain-containing protein [Elusimicrobiales bacterium]